MRIRLLGPVELATAAGEMTEQPLRKRDRALLALLALEHGRVLSTDRIVDLLWDGEPPAQPRAAVHTHVSRLRVALRQAAGDDRPLLHTRGDGYLLTLPPAVVDAYVFRDLVDQARAHPDLVRRAALLRSALDLWRGPALAGAATATMRLGLCAALDEERVRALEDRIEADLELGRHATLVPELATLTDEHPFRERFHGQLMLALFRAGRRAEALDAYRRARRVLVDELGLEPGAELQAVERLILAAEPAPSPAGGSAVTPAQLPADVSDFTGRQSDLDALDRRLWTAAGGTRAVAIAVIAGTAGVGKSALAVHWAHRVRHQFPDGQLYLNLRGHAQAPPLPPIAALARLLSALGLPADQVPTDPDQAADLYRSLLADRRVLIVLDDAATADQVRPLLPGTAGCMVVVTSRDQLGGLIARDGAHRLALGVLTAGDARHLLDRLLGDVPAGAESAAVDELARLCVYLPLALRVAAANATVEPRQPITAYVERLREGNRLAALEVGGDEDAGVRVAFDLSYRAQPTPARRLFRLLGVLPGRDVTAATAAALTGDEPGAERLLHLLSAAHLVERPGPDRFALHDLLRLYARERAAAEDGAGGMRAAIGRLLDWYEQTVGAAVLLAYPEKLRLPAQNPPPRQPFTDLTQAMVWLDAERTNLIAAIEHAAEHGPRPAAWRLADALRGYFWLRGDAVDWRTAAEAGMSAARAEGNLQACAAMQISLADVEWSQARYRPAIEQYERALDFARRSGWHAGEATILGNLGGLTQETGQLSLAAQRLNEALLLARRSGTASGEAAILGNLGLVQLSLGELTAAADTLGQALACFGKLGSRTGEIQTLNDLGQVHHALGNFDAALEHLHRSAAMTVETGDIAADQTHHIAAVHRDAGRLAEALRYAEQAVALARKSEYRRFEADALNVRGTVHLALGHPEKALEDHNAALEIAESFDGGHPIAEARLGLAAAYRLLGRPGPALGQARQALTTAQADGLVRLEARVRACIAAIEG